MMEKYPFDSAGVQTLLAELYALPDPSLEFEAHDARTQFGSWLRRHFDFNAAQTAYVIGLDPTFSDLAGDLVAFHIGHRFPIELTVQGEPDDDDDDDDGPRGKLILFNQSRQVSYNRTNGTLSVGYLQVLISYPPGD